MASIKNLKSKGMAYRRALVDGPTVGYALRKQQFADTPPAKELRPLRHLARLLGDVLEQRDRQLRALIAAGAAGPIRTDFDSRAMILATYHSVITKLARAGAGQSVLHFTKLATRSYHEIA